MSMLIAPQARPVRGGVTEARQNVRAARFSFLDGLRGLAALFVVIHHVHLQVVFAGDASLSVNTRMLTRCLEPGYLGVSVFIVLSGYCLMLPIASGQRSGTDVVGFARRRALRILPPYYACLAGSLALIWFVPALATRSGTLWDHALPAFSKGVVLSHLLLVHDVRSTWAQAIDPPMWSVAVEWQIYFVFILLLLPMWRRWGLALTFAFAFGVSAISPFLLHRGYELHPWYVGLFVMGMAGAVATFDGRRAVTRFVAPTWCCCVLWGAIGIVSMSSPGLFIHKLVWDVVVGFLTTMTIVSIARQHTAATLNPPPFLARILECRVAMSLGRSSYSLYLVHMPIIAALYFVLVRRLSGDALLAAMLAACVPVSLAIAYVFHLAFERPFMPSARTPKRHQGEKRVPGTAIKLGSAMQRNGVG